MTSKTDQLEGELWELAAQTSNDLAIAEAGSDLERSILFAALESAVKLARAAAPAVEDSPPYHAQLCTGPNCSECARLGVKWTQAGEDATPRTPLNERISKAIEWCKRHSYYELAQTLEEFVPAMPLAHEPDCEYSKWGTYCTCATPLRDKLVAIQLEHETNYVRCEQRWQWSCSCGVGPDIYADHAGCHKRTREHWADVVLAALRASRRM